MKLPPARSLLLAACIVLLHACTERVAESGSTAVVANTATASASTESSFEASCKRIGGAWQNEPQQCALTEALCANFGQWVEQTGCIMASVEPTDCVGLSGLQIVDDQCVITRLASDELEQTGLSEEK